MSSLPPPTPLTAAGRETLEAELRELVAVHRPEVVARMAAARSEGDLTENAAYQQAREDQSRIEGRIAELEAILRNHVLIEQAAGDGSARLGSRVAIADEFGEAEYLIVGPQEADPRAGRISTQSPVGRALLGARAGDTVSVVTPEGTRSVEVRAVS